MKEISQFEVINEILKDGTPKVAKEIAKLAREKGFDWARENANSALYKMLKNSLVVKIETEKAPLWTLPQFSNSNVGTSVPIKKIPTVFAQKEVPLSANNDLTVKIQEVEIMFQFDPEMNSNDPYMSGDWLNNKIFVSLNQNHPFWQSYITSDEKKYIYLTLVAEEVYVQHQVAKSTSVINVERLLSMRDKAMRDIVANN
jgi:hypothetical protein